jgi:hypothetical protein
MDKLIRIIPYRNKITNKKTLSIPKITINPDYNITTYKNTIYPNKNYTRIENKLLSTELSSKFNNYKLFHKNYLDNKSNHLYKTIWTDGNTHSNNSHKKAIYLRTTKTKLIKNTNKSHKVPTKLLNDFFKPQLTESYKSMFSPTKIKKFKKNYNYPSESKKEISPHNYLYYYFPNLFNVPNNRITGPQNLDSSKYLISPVPTISFNEEVQTLKVSRTNNNNNENDKNLYTSINNSGEKNNKNNPLFIQKFYDIDLLKNVRFEFKNSIERAKYNNLVKSFYTARNLKYVLAKQN